MDYWASSQQKALYEDIYSMNLITWLAEGHTPNNVIQPKYIVVTKVETFFFFPFSLCLHLLSSNAKWQMSVIALLIRSI